MPNYKLGIIGAGNMSNAILSGIISHDVLNANEIIVSDIDDEKLRVLNNKGVNTTKDNDYLLSNVNYVILAIKPQVAKKILPTLYFPKNINVISIMAGIKKQSIRKMIGDVNITRIMPNTPCLLGAGMCAIDNKDFDENGKALVENIFASLGKIVNISEDYFDAVTAVSGSGPAYVYMFIKAMIDEGVKLGLTYETSKELTLQTFIGSTKMVENTTISIDTLIKNVCSPGGTTIQAVDFYNENKLSEIIMEGMERCENRSKELSKDE